MSRINDFSVFTFEDANFSQTDPYFLKILQMNNLELKEYAQELFESNPFLTDKDSYGDFYDEQYDFLNFQNIPDIIIEHKCKDLFEVAINEQNSPHIFTDQNLYTEISEKIQKNSEKNYIDMKIKEANQLICAVNFRNFILTKIMKEIIYRQYDFLIENEEYMNPTSIKDVAISIMLSENIIHKAIVNKIVLTPRGIFKMREFFPEKNQSTCNFFNFNDDLDLKKYINQLINDEPKNSPYSDNDIACLLQRREINLSLKIVTKYRENLNIPAQRQRNKIYNSAKT